MEKEIKTCVTCNGAGVVDTQAGITREITTIKCPTCNGSGAVEVVKPLI